MESQPVRIGIVGAGGNVRERHVPGFRAIPGVELVSVCNRSRESSQRAAAEFGIPAVYDNWLELVEAEDTDAICIGTWPYLHCPVTLAALENGKHVLTEARMAMNTDEAYAMLEASRANPDLVAQVVPSPATLKFDRTIQEFVSDGYLGDVLVIELQVNQSTFVDAESPIHWRQDFDLSGYNTLGLGIWYEALLRWVGPAARVLAMTQVVVKQRRDPQGLLRAVTVPDHLDVVCQMASGAQAHLRFSTVTGLARGAEAWLHGSQGTLRLDAEAGVLYGARRGDAQLKEIPISEEKQGGWRVEEEFVNAIRGTERVTHTTFEDGVRYMEFTEAVARSAQDGQVVSLPL